MTVSAKYFLILIAVLCWPQTPHAEYCYECNSLSNVNCATSPSLAGTRCTTSSSCVSYRAATIIYRECGNMNSLNACQRAGEQNCDICYGDFCNTRVFNENFSCIQCNSTSTSDDCAEGSSFLGKDCTNSKNGKDECYNYYDDNLLMHRGCMSDESSKVCVGEKCKKCSTENCNTQKLMVGTSMSCAKCKGEMCDPAWSIVQRPCSGLVPYDYKGDGCYTKLTYANGDLSYERGCLSELSLAEQELCHTSPDTCHTCSEKGCNQNINGFDFKCYQCDSHLDPNCENNVTVLQPQYCWTSYEQCFVYRRPDSSILRNCRNSTYTSELSLHQCSTDKVKKNNRCVVCNHNSCNTMTPNSASPIAVSLGLLVAAAVVATKVL